MRVDTPQPRSMGRALTPRDRYAAADARLSDDGRDGTYTVQRLRIKYIVPPLAPCPDWDREVVRHIGRHMPAEVRKLRAIGCLEGLKPAHPMWRDEPCAACASSPGWLDETCTARCPICGGFCFLPRTVAIWYRRELQALEATGASEARRAHRLKVLEART